MAATIIPSALIQGQSSNTTRQVYESIDALVADGLVANPEVRAAFARWEAVRKQVPARRALPEPSVQYTHYLQSVETRVGPQRGAAGLSQRLPWFGKLRLEGRIAESRGQAAYHQYAATVQRVAAEIEAAYWDYLFLLRAIQITQQSVELLRNWEQVVLAKYTTAQAGHPDVIKAQVEVLSLEDRIESLRQRQRPHLQRLSAAVGIPLTPDVIREVPIPRFDAPASLDSLLSELLQHNPELLASRALQAAARQTVSRERLNYLPDLTAGGQVIFTGENPMLGDDPQNGRDPVMFSVGLSIPIRWKKYRALEQSARAEQRSAELTTAHIENRLLSGLELVRYELQDAARRVRLYQEALIPRAGQAMLTTEAAYISNKVDFLTLIESQRVLLDYQLSYQESLADQARQRAQLFALLGRYPVNTPFMEENLK
ncbi:MAG: TolC family protein [Candidatus Neomarinimicrobiota bacterium]